MRPVYDLIVTCHEPYRVKFLDECANAWDRLKVPGRRILVADGFSVPWSRDGWEVVSGSWGHPSPARNAGMKASDSPWIVFWDADNVPPRGFDSAVVAGLKSAGSTVGVLCTSWGGGDPRDVWGVDTNSAWRREAIEDVGGWEMATLEDWRMGWRMVPFGWRPKKLLGPRVVRRKHDQQRTFEADIWEKLWEARDFGIVTLLRGDRTLTETWLEAFEYHKKPARLGLTVTLDCDEDFKNWFKAQAQERLVPHLKRLTFLEPKEFGAIEADSNVMTRHKRHQRVVWLYQTAIEKTPEPWILTWEDDVEPLSADLLYRMNGHLRPSTKVGSISPVYQERYRNKACLSSRSDAWAGGISIKAALDGGFREIGAHPAGFALWRRSDLESLDAQKCWDFEACRAVRSRGAAPHVFPEEVKHHITWAQGSEPTEHPLSGPGCIIQTETI